MSAAILPQKKLIILVLSGIGAALFWKIGAMTNARQNAGLNPGELPSTPAGYGEKKDVSEQKCCDKPPSKSALMLAR